MASFIPIYSNFLVWFLSMNRYPGLATSLAFFKMNDRVSRWGNYQMSPQRIMRNVVSRGHVGEEFLTSRGLLAMATLPSLLYFMGDPPSCTSVPYPVLV